MIDGLIGKNIHRVEDQALLTGTARFVDDIKIPGMLECAFVRSPHPHANILSINTDAAQAHEGVFGVYSYKDLYPLLVQNFIPPDNPTLKFSETTKPIVIAKDEVCFVGEIVAVIIASSRYIAEDAVALVDVNYEILPSTADCRAALLPDAPSVHKESSDNVVAQFRTEFGDCKKAFANADHIFSCSLKQHRGSGHPIEGRGIVAQYDSVTEGLMVWSSTQGAHRVRNTLIEIYGLDENQVRTAAPDVGGGFGSKHIVYPEEIIICGAALIQKCPLKWTEDRREHFLAAIQERDQYWNIEVATDTKGKLLGFRGNMVHDQGAYTLLGFNVAHNASLAVPGPYVLPNYEMDVTIAATNLVGTIPVRGAGYPEGTFAMERAMDLIADKLELDRAEVRQRNLITADMIPYELPLRARDGSVTSYESGDFPACMQKAIEASDYYSFEERQKSALRQGRFLGIGLANCVKITGRGPFETGIVRIGPSGQITVHTGAMPMGQGIKTAYAQICADQFGVSAESVKVIAGDTGTVPMGIGGYGSRQTVTAGSSIHLAAIEVREKALKAAAYMLEVSDQDLELSDGQVNVKGVPDLSISLSDISKSLSGAVGYSRPKDFDPGLEATSNFLPTGLTYGNGVHVVELEVDIGTGGVHIIRYTAVNDSGRLINPSIVEGQILGGVAHGIGNALFEWMGYDESGQPVTTTFAEYLLPTAPVVPNVEIVHHETLSTVNPLGVKGVGEAGVIPAAPAIMAAIENALLPFDICITETPITPNRIIELISEAKA